MSLSFSRRDVLKCSFTGAMASALVTESAHPVAAIDYTEPVPESMGLSIYRDKSLIVLRWNNLIAAGYRAHATQKFPYFHPLAGPVTGLPLTCESALPYPHHRGLWLGLEPVNGGNYWSDGPLSQGQIESVQLDVGETNESVVSFTDMCDWHREQGGAPCRDSRRFTFSVINDRLRLLDVDITWTARESITIKRAKHGFFALRCAPDLAPMYGGTLANSEGGVGAEGTYGQPAKWCGYFGRRAGRPDVVEGITICNHPENFSGDCPWFTRDYGHLSPSPFNFLDRPWTLAKGDSIRLRYLIVLHAGTPAEAGLDARYYQWTSGRS